MSYLAISCTSRYWLSIVVMNHLKNGPSWPVPGPPGPAGLGRRGPVNPNSSNCKYAEQEFVRAFGSTGLVSLQPQE